MTTKVRIVRPETRLVADLELSTWRTIADNARYQAEKCKDWTIVNLLDTVFRMVDEATREEKEGR